MLLPNPSLSVRMLSIRMLFRSSIPAPAPHLVYRGCRRATRPNRVRHRWLRNDQ